ncbi:hypothetical protein GCM10010441_43240 [Kitasatospora paracochleata]|uniref:Secreted protein n=1 Tax=Kitasatospora paracochleata TaxID=58354 RepID=A0ABT1J1D2_9ACTN|nr:hypothetical protein [Kitasatospora paracochleata]MCP2310891.1 hypothetical protein [Kitasatospora paracochleata]
MRIKRFLGNTVLAAALAVPGAVAATAPAHAVTGCSWTGEGSVADEWVQDGNGTWVKAGFVTVEYDYCGNTRSTFTWYNSFRTTAHPGITGAWVRTWIQGTLWSNDGRSSATVGSLDGPSVSSPSIYVHANNEDSWYAASLLHITYSNGKAKDCAAYSGTWNFHTGQQTSGAQNGSCSRP